MQVQVARGLRHGDAELPHQPYRFQLELAAELPSLHSCSPMGENTLSRCPRNRQQLKLFADKLSGIPLLAWQKFLGLFTESQTADDLSGGLDRLAAAYPTAALPEGRAELIRDKMVELAAIIGDQGE